MKACFIYLTKPTSSTPDRLSGVHLMAQLLAENGCGRDMCRSVYMTSKEGGAKPSASDITSNREKFLEAIGQEPVILVAMGSNVMTPLTKGYYPISLVRGEPVPVTDDMPYPKGSMIYGMFDPAAVWGDPGCEDLFRRDVRHLAALIKDAPEKDPPVDNIVIHSPEEVDDFGEAIPSVWEELPPEDRFLVVDCEWHGRNWMEPGRYIRSVQVGYAPGAAVTIELYREHPDFNDDSLWPRKAAEKKAMIADRLAHPVAMCKDMDAMWKAIKRLLQGAGYPIIGHNIIADWQWLLSFGVDIRSNVFYDTMLAEHLINSDGPFRLDEVAMRRTPFGRYCKDVDLWVHHHKDFCKDGYGAVPTSLLTPYGGADVECPRRIMKAQYPILESYGMLEKRGPNKEYPSLLDSTLLNELATDELEQNGLPVDRKRLTDLIDAYQAMRAQLLSEVTLMAMAQGMPDFNPNSQPQMRMLLFGKLGLTPVKTTGGQSWGDAVGGFEMGSEDMPASSTDKSVLEMLQNAHPLVKKLLQFRRIDQVCKTWLRHPDEDGEGGLESLLWADGKLHASFLPLTSTGRYKSANPNCFPADVEVLTSEGWMYWDDAYVSQDSIKLAQWDPETPDREVTFATPDEWHVSSSEVVRFHTRQHIDIVCTPNHRFEVYNRKTGRRKCVTALDLPKCGEYMLPQAGRIVSSPGTVHLTDAQVALLCAMQADGHICKSSYKGVESSYGVEFALTKQRKIDRIRKALNDAGVTFRESHDLNAIGNPRTRFYIGKDSRDMVFAGFKEFSSKLFEFDADTIRRISDEVFLWDGTVRDGWHNYSSAKAVNTDLVQALQALSGKRAQERVYVSSAGSVSYQVDVSLRQLSSLANGTLEHIQGERPVYCATMPKGTLVVRYNGKVAFTRNSQNWPKKADGYLKDIFGEDKVPPMLRTIVKPPEGWMMMEGDFCQAELFTMANVSGDQNMIRLLTTPGLDLHDSTTLSSFNMKMVDENDREVTEDDLVKMAAEIGAESDEFQHYMKTMRYVQVDGKVITRAQFKAGPRISAKSLNFGIPYGRGAKACALMIKAETGMETPLKEIENQCAQMIEAWKTVTFPTAWRYLEGCQQAVYDPGYVVNPWGFRKTFNVRPGEIRKDFEREAGNFP